VLSTDPTNAQEEGQSTWWCGCHLEEEFNYISGGSHAKKRKQGEKKITYQI
jgi:hypothetical protein